MNIFITENQREREKKRESHNAESCDFSMKYFSGSIQVPKPNCRGVIER